MKGKAFLAHMRPDLERMDSRNVDARVTLAMCDSSGIPRQKGFFFIATPRVARQITTKGGHKQDRSNPMPGCEAWNGTIEKPLGRSQIFVRLQHADWLNAHKVECIAQKSPFRDDTSPPGNAAFCRSDGENDAGVQMAKRWNGQTFERIVCQGAVCPFRQPYETGRKNSDGRPETTKAAKTAFTLTARLDEDDLPPLMVSLATGSDVNYAEFVGCMTQLHDQWDALCASHGLNIPLPDYGIPLRLSAYLQTGGGSRYPRVDYAFDGNIEQLFQLVRRNAGRFQELSAGMPSADRLITGEIDTADRAEIIALDVEEPDEREEKIERRQAIITDRFRAAVTREDPPADTTPKVDPAATAAPLTAAVTAPVQTATPSTHTEPKPPTLLERANAAKNSAMRPLLAEAIEAQDIDAAAVLLERSAAKVSSLDPSVASSASTRAWFLETWQPYAAALRESYPALSAGLATVGCPPPSKAEVTPDDDDDIPFVGESVAPKQAEKTPEQLVRAICDEYLQPQVPKADAALYFKRVLTAAKGAQPTIAIWHAEKGKKV